MKYESNTSIIDRQSKYAMNARNPYNLVNDSDDEENNNKNDDDVDDDYVFIFWR